MQISVRLELLIQVVRIREITVIQKTYPTLMLTLISASILNTNIHLNIALILPEYSSEYLP